MALKDLLVYVDQTQSAPSRLRLGADLASRHASRLTALYVRHWTQDQLEQRDTAELGLVSAQDLDRLEQHIEGSIDATGKRLRDELDALARERALQTEWRSLDGSAAVVVPQHARCADLCIVGWDGLPAGASEEYTF
ncbi:MAG TPA: universal stress protein, partial [Burkholderiales bacterium]|nr:universal stress protein [Burkholderiales bacterium]